MKWMSIFNLFGLPPPDKRARVEVGEARSELFYYSYGLASLNLDGVRSVLGFFQHRPDLYESRLEIVRFAVGYPGSLTDLMPGFERFEASEQQLRQFWTSVEVRLTSLVTGEPPRALPWESEASFRGCDLLNRLR
ncbi:MAG: hypothetical protein KF764_10930 [Labilithrix sp.]|nr:hypothetical protein [Labilithrix sp.]MBX3225350.1 hypothetical protein [Labilithrix sp.]